MGMRSEDVAEVLDRPISRELLTSGIPARLAYVARDGTPRAIPIGFHWDGAEFVLWTSENAAKVPALEAHPQVALTIDTNGFPPHVLLVRGVAALEAFDGVPDDYFRTASVDEQHRPAWEAEVRSLYRRMVRIGVTPEWVKLLDFETTLPSAVEELARKREQGATNVVDD